MNTLLLLVLGQ